MPMDTSFLFLRYVICTEPNKYTFEHNGGSFSNLYVAFEHRDTSGPTPFKKMIIDTRDQLHLGPSWGCQMYENDIFIYGYVNSFCEVCHL